MIEIHQGSKIAYRCSQLINTRWNINVGSTPSSRGAGPLPTAFIGITNEI